MGIKVGQSGYAVQWHPGGAGTPVWYVLRFNAATGRWEEIAGPLGSRHSALSYARQHELGRAVDRRVM